MASLARSGCCRLRRRTDLAGRRQDAEDRHRFTRRIVVDENPAASGWRPRRGDGRSADPQVLSRGHDGGRCQRPQADAGGPTARRPGADHDIRQHLPGCPGLQPADGVPKPRRGGRGAPGHGPGPVGGVPGPRVPCARLVRGRHGLPDGDKPGTVGGRRPQAQGLGAAGRCSRSSHAAGVQHHAHSNAHWRGAYRLEHPG